MPFQSEKQRRFLHANHPEIAKRWERDYAHGGILDINESEEIIDNGGNEIELTDYNAEFDDPNDLSTGVKTLFMKKGGNVRLGPHTATDLLAKKNPDGTRSKYQPPGGGETSLGSGAAYSGGASDRGPRDDPDRFGPVSKPSQPQTVPEGINIHQDTGKEEEPYIIVGGQKVHQSLWGTSADPREKYDSEEQMLDLTYAFNPPGATKKHTYITNKKKAAYEKSLADQKAKLKKMGMGKLFKALALLLVGMPPEMVIKQVMISPTDMKTLIQESIPVMQAKKDYMTALGNAKADYETLGMASHHHAVDTEIQTIDQTLLDLTKPKDKEEKDDGPELPPQLGGPSTEEMATEYGMSNLDRIRAGQAKYAAYIDKIEREKFAREDNPIVSGTEMDIIALGNSGGLANLFRVKKQ